MTLRIHGQRFGRLVAIEPTTERYQKAIKWRCACDCGGEAVVIGHKLVNGNSKSCGCSHLKNGRARKKDHLIEYRLWTLIKDRCFNPKSSNYRRYGGRGITVCERWMKFDNFLADMGPRPMGQSIDRINNNGPYSPENCRWASRAEQARNRSTNFSVTAGGETMCVEEWGRRTGLHATTIQRRLRRGLTPEQAVSAPSRNRHKSAQSRNP